MNAGTVFGDYRVLSVVGYGGMGVVYLAEDTNLDRRVALKVLAPQYTTDAGFRARFERESRLAAALDHPNVVPVYEAGAVNGVLFIAMRYVAGSDLRVVIDRDGHFVPSRALGITAQLASALDAAHDLGLIHRDVKPANVLVSARFGADGGEHVYLSDFGLTKRSASKSGLTQLGQLVGTIDYIAPEQMGGGSVDGRADIYALGCVFFEMLAGQPPFLRETDLATMAAHLHEPPPSLTALRPDLPPEIDETIAQVLAKTPDQRFATGADFVRHARASLAAGTQPPVSAGHSDQTVIVAPPIPPDASPSSPTVLAGTAAASKSDEPEGPPTAAIAAAGAAAGAAASTTGQATVLQAMSPPSMPVSTPAAAAPPTAGPPPASAAAPPPDSGPFYQGGGYAPPSQPPGGSSYPPPPPPPPRSRTPIIAVAAAGAVGLVLVLLVAFAILPRTPGASPTLIAQVSPSPTATLLTPAPSPLRTASPSPSGSATPTATPAATSPAPTPTATQTATVPPPTIPPATATPTPAPIGDFARLLAFVDPSVGHCTEDISDYDVLPVTEALCNEGTYIRRYALFNNEQDLKTAWKWFNITSSDTCSDGDQTWVYSDIDPEVTRGRLACFTKSDTTSTTPQLMFTLADRNLLGVIVGNDESTVADLYNFWAVDAGALVPPSQ